MEHTAEGFLSRERNPTNTSMSQIRTHNPEVSRDSNMGGTDLWSNMLLLDHGGTTIFKKKVHNYKIWR